MTLPQKFDYEALWRYVGQPDELTEKKAENVVDRLYKVCTPREIHREYAVERSTDGICIIGTNVVLKGENIARHLDGCSACILKAVTLGIGVDNLIRTLAFSDMSASVLCDSAASVLVEQVSTEQEGKLKNVYREKELFLTESYSPGYGDFPLEANSDIEKLLMLSKRIGVTVTEDYLMLPRKSITAVIGISEKNVKGSRATCESCKLYDKCTLRKEGKHCGSR